MRDNFLEQLFESPNGGRHQDRMNVENLVSKTPNVRAGGKLFRRRLPAELLANCHFVVR
jgi:hypothetical protein